MMNRVDLIGRLTRDPELRKTNNGTSVLSFTLAVDRAFKTPGQPEADFINCQAWNKTAENMARYLHKGSLIAVEGRIQTRSYDNQQGQRVYVTEVVADRVQFLESRKSQMQSGQDAYGQQDYGYGGQNSSYQNTPYGQNSSRNTYQSNAGSPYGSQSSAGNYTASSSNDFSDAFDENSTLDVTADDLPF